MHTHFEPRVTFWASIYRVSYGNSISANKEYLDALNSSLNLRGELLNSERFVRCCIGVALNGPFLTAQNSAIQQYPQCRHLILYDNMIYSSWDILFNCINPDRITLQQMFFSTIWDISLWSNQWWISLFSHPLIFFPFFVNTLISRTLDTRKLNAREWDIKVFTNLKL